MRWRVEAAASISSGTLGARPSSASTAFQTLYTRCSSCGLRARATVGEGVDVEACGVFVRCDGRRQG